MADYNHNTLNTGGFEDGTAVSLALGGRGIVGSVDEQTASAANAVAPAVTVVSPPAGTKLARTDVVTLEVTDDEALLRSVILVARMRDAEGDELVQELVHDGTNFSALYATSTRSEVVGGYRYQIRRVAGWRSRPSFRTFAIDEAGNQA